MGPEIAVWSANDHSSQVHDHDTAPGRVRQRPLTVDELAEVAVFLAFDRASGMTSTVANVSCARS
jgi:hypothetical protein